MDFRQRHFIKELDKLRQEPLHYIKFLDERVNNVAHFVSDETRIQARYNIGLEAYSLEVIADDEQEALEIAEMVEAYKANKKQLETAR